jgi:hypothetical protein
VAETEWVECEMRIANPYEACKVGGFSWVSREDCASCPVPKMAAALEECSRSALTAEVLARVEAALALYRKGGR